MCSRTAASCTAPPPPPAAAPCAPTSAAQPIVELVVPSIELGEGPHWDIVTQALYFVDIFGKSIHKYVPATKRHTSAFIGTNNVTLIVPIDGQMDRYLISVGRKLCLIDWDGESGTVSKIKTLVEIDADSPDNRFNDGKCDAMGRLWAGSMGGEPINGQVKPWQGCFISFGPCRQLKTHLPPKSVGISNGLTWSLDNKRFYYIDTSKGTVDQFDFDLKEGTISNRTVIFTLEKHVTPGALDGMTIDTEGYLWIAIFNGFCVIQIDPNKPETLLQKIAVPAKQVTSVMFGGLYLDELYVTSAAFTVDGCELPPPDHGATYCIKNTGARGVPAFSFKIN